MKSKLLAIMFGAVLVLAACGGDKAEKEKAVDKGATTTVDAEAIVQKSCIGCHGGNLEGGMGPKLSDVGSRLSETEIHDVIVNGKGAMPAVKMTEEESNAVAKWLAEKK